MPEKKIYSDKPEFEVAEWCKDKHGQEPAEVHLFIDTKQGCEVIIRFIGPSVIDDLILALTRHRNNVWPIDDHPMKETFSEHKDYRKES